MQHNNTTLQTEGHFRGDSYGGATNLKTAAFT